MNSRQGGNVLIDYLIFMMVIGCFFCIYMVKRYSDSRVQEAVKLQASVDELKHSMGSVFTHLDEIDEELKANESGDEVDISNMRSVVATVNSHTQEINQAQEHLARMRDQLQSINNRINEIPREIKVVHKNAQMLQAQAGIEWRGYEWITVKKGKRVKAIKYWPVKKKAKGIKRIDLPGAEESKRKLVEAGL